MSNTSTLGKIMEQKFLEIIFMHVKGRKVIRKKSIGQAFGLNPNTYFPHLAHARSSADH